MLIHERQRRFSIHRASNVRPCAQVVSHVPHDFFFFINGHCGPFSKTFPDSSPFLARALIYHQFGAFFYPSFCSCFGTYVPPSPRTSTTHPVRLRRCPSQSGDRLCHRLPLCIHPLLFLDLMSVSFPGGFAETLI